MSRRRIRVWNRRSRRGGGYVLGIGAGDKLVCCTQRSRGQMKFSSDRAPEYLSPQAARRRPKIKDIRRCCGGCGVIKYV